MSNSKQQSVTQNRILLLLLALTLIRGLIYASVTPPWWQSHDEEYHFAQIRHLIDQWSNPASGQDQSWLQEMAGTFAAFPVSRWTLASERPPNIANISDRYASLRRPSLSYYPYAWLGQFLVHQDLLFQLLALRVVSVFITCGTILFAFLSARQIFADSVMMQVLVPWLILFNPSFMVIDSAINDGNLAVLLSTIVFYLLLLEVTKHHIGWRSVLALGLTMLAMWSKATAYFLLFVWGLLLFGYAWKLGRKYWLWIGIVTVVLTAILFFLPAYLQNKLINVWILLLQDGVSSEGITYALSLRYFRDTFFSFWIILGYFVYRLDQIWYLVLFLLSLLAGFGLIFYVWDYLRHKTSSLGIEQKGLLLSILFAGLSIAVLMGSAFIRHTGGERLARYIFPAIVPLSILMVTGWRTLLPSTWRNVGLLFLAGGLFLFDTMVWLNYAVPWYYPFWPH